MHGDLTEATGSVVVGSVCHGGRKQDTLLSLTYDRNWFAAVVKQVRKEPTAALLQFPETYTPTRLCTRVAWPKSWARFSY